ncbi:MAG: spore maturation protein [Clostridia bacterium]|nr:spore maturation protein [Clostridia bacterium]
MLNYISNIAMPLVIFIIVFKAVLEKKKIFELFLKGAKEGIEITIKLFPTLVGLFLAVGLLRNSGLIELIVNFINPLLIKLQISSEILPLCFLRPISGSASIAVATDIMKSFGVDSIIGITAAVIMGATETTLYTIAVYTGSVKIKNIRFVLKAALIADIVGIITSIIVCKILFKA